MRERLQFLGFRRQSVQLLRELDVVSDHPNEPFASNLSNRGPYLERTKPSRILRPPLVKVRRRILGASIELEVGRMKDERVMKKLTIPHQRTSRFERCVQPFVRIDGA